MVSLHYCQPIARNFPAVDAVKLPGSLFQMTVSLSHSINYTALKSVLESMPDCASYDLYFFVPEDIFSDFASQSIVGMDEALTMTTPNARVLCVRQWALCIRIQS